MPRDAEDAAEAVGDVVFAVAVDPAREDRPGRRVRVEDAPPGDAEVFRRDVAAPGRLHIQDAGVPLAATPHEAHQSDDRDRRLLVDADRPAVEEPLVARRELSPSPSSGGSWRL